MFSISRVSRFQFRPTRGRIIPLALGTMLSREISVSSAALDCGYHGRIPWEAPGGNDGSSGGNDSGYCLPAVACWHVLFYLPGVANWLRMLLNTDSRDSRGVDRIYELTPGIHFTIAGMSRLKLADSISTITP